jgi:phosphatidylserine decarboxylase
VRRALERLAARAQKVLPQKALTALVHRLMRCESRWLKNLLIRAFSAFAGVDLDEARSPRPDDYPCFNAFFTRELRAGARPPHPDPAAVACPCDGRVSELGNLHGKRLLQAKGTTYSLDTLLAGDPAAGLLANGLFFTIYLSPRDYHRVHMPLGGTLQRMVYVPGRLFSVAPSTVRHIPGLFVRNERVVSVFDTPRGMFAQVLVGAMLVASMETAWAGELAPSRSCVSTDYANRSLSLDRGAEMGRFNMGSTVILVLPPGMAVPEPGLRPGDAVRVGQRLATLAASGMTD